MEKMAFKPLHHYVSSGSWENRFWQLDCSPSDSVPLVFLIDRGSNICQTDIWQKYKIHPQMASAWFYTKLREQILTAGLLSIVFCSLHVSHRTGVLNSGPRDLLSCRDYLHPGLNLKNSISLFRCVWLRLELNSAGKWISRSRVKHPSYRRRFKYLWNMIHRAGETDSDTWVTRHQFLLPNFLI